LCAELHASRNARSANKRGLTIFFTFP